MEKSFENEVLEFINTTVITQIDTSKWENNATYVVKYKQLPIFVYYDKNLKRFTKLEYNKAIGETVSIEGMAEGVCYADKTYRKTIQIPE